MLIRVLCLASVVALAACEPNETETQEPAPAPTAVAASTGDVATPPAQANAPEAGEPIAIIDEVVSTDDVQVAASVAQLDLLQASGVKVFGTAGGDPAMNGLHTYIAFFGSPAEGWKVFRLGDFRDYRVVSQTEESVVLELREDELDEATGQIGQQTRQVNIAWIRSADGAPPDSITSSVFR